MRIFICICDRATDEVVAYRSYEAADKFTEGTWGPTLPRAIRSLARSFVLNGFSNTTHYFTERSAEEFVKNDKYVTIRGRT